jgi:hypothetical protein
MKIVAIFLQALLVIAGTNASKPDTAGPAQVAGGGIHRQYKMGETMKYHMKAKNDAWEYEIDAIGTVGKNKEGAWEEQFAWSNMVSAGHPLPLPPESANFRQELSLDPAYAMKLPDFSKVSPMLVGPMADMMTFYSDLWLAIKAGNLSKAGDHLYVPVGGPNSWADGGHVILGEDSIDFDFTLAEMDAATKTAKLVAKHVPPKEPKVRLSTEWMKAKVADTPNNWVEVSKNGEKYAAEVGKETFTVELKVSLEDGKILHVAMENPVTAIHRECTDAALTQCGPATPRQIMRRVEVELQQ